MKYAVAIVLALIAVVAWAAVTGRNPTPARHTNLSPERVRKLVEALVNRGYDGGFLIIEIAGEEPFFQLRKQLKGGKVSLRSDFPHTRWSEPFYHQFRSGLEERRLAYVETSGQGDVALDGLVDKVIVVTLDPDVDKAAELVSFVFKDIFRVDLQQQGQAYLHNVSPLNERIGFDSTR